MMIKRLFKRKNNLNLSNTILPVYNPKKYDSVYNNAERHCKHSWFYFTSTINFAHYGFSDLGKSETKHRICEKCFLWESDYCKGHYGNDWDFMGYGKEAFNRLTEEKVNQLIIQE